MDMPLPVRDAFVSLLAQCRGELERRGRVAAKQCNAVVAVEAFKECLASLARTNQGADAGSAVAAGDAAAGRGSKSPGLRGALSQGAS